MSLHIACPHCLAVNRVLPEQLEAGPNCGRCHQPLFTGRAMAVDAKGFESMLANTDLPVLVDFWAPWCGPCRTMAPQLEQVAVRLEPRLRVIKLDIEAHPRPAAQFDIQSIPTLALFGGGRELGRHTGAISAQQIVTWVVPLIMNS